MPCSASLCTRTCEPPGHGNSLLQQIQLPSVMGHRRLRVHNQQLRQGKNRTTCPSTVAGAHSCVSPCIEMFWQNQQSCQGNTHSPLTGQSWTAEIAR